MMTRGFRIALQDLITLAQVLRRVLLGSRNTELDRTDNVRWQSALGRGCQVERLQRYFQIADARPKIGGPFFVFMVDATVALCPNVGAATVMSLSVETFNSDYILALHTFLPKGK
ncbi:hypothetical protein COCMIDRAFT_84721 [Bipolaris oryzae ATCC 44560]|uniref:Uncharacterized protein n=1 Tax=Bipolaris oryzae ATCC 44560 TaxID=930090 RepID=W7A080_COCMI|nr:uncharacterized protein COCMIDRAFT_84721 [Bipolaris oryzae ATCC 44560]EUC49421.1 hypothetical protein COCMIDRAFT_84721 [Bipolaris oryzae ATCC 44560]